jgi:hypothetical protein
MRKKRLACALFLIFAAPLAFCDISSLMTAAKYNEFDAPLIDGITYFLSATASFARMGVPETSVTVL